MATFATESDVRLKFQLNDAELAPSALVEASLADAHVEVLRYLDPAFNAATPDAGVVLGETLLAGAHVYRTLAAKEAFDQKQVTVGGQSISAGGRYESLMSLAALTEASAWYMLEPFLMCRPAKVLLAATETLGI